MKKGITLLVLLLLGLFAKAQPSDQIALTVTNISPQSGQIRAALFVSPDGFPDNPEKSAFKMSSPVSDSVMVLIFRDIPEGEYVAAVFHDENNNETLDKTEKGIPLEPLGISNNPALKFGPPKYDKAVFLKGKNYLELTIELKRFNVKR